MVSVKAAATGKVSWGPMVMGLGPLEHPAEQGQTSNPSQLHNLLLYPNVQLWILHRGQGSIQHTFSPVEQVVRLTFKS